MACLGTTVDGEDVVGFQIYFEVELQNMLLVAYSIKIYSRKVVLKENTKDLGQALKKK